MPDTIPPTFDAEFTAQIAACNAARIAAEQERQARRRARTPEQRRADFIACRECDGAGSFSDWNTRGPDCREWDCEKCDGSGEHEKRAKEWEPAVALWNATPAGPDGDEKFCAVEARFPDWDIADVLMTMEEECGEVK